jgi:uncharacterized membrane protein YtjA (UPF0391 family)
MGKDLQSDRAGNTAAAVRWLSPRSAGIARAMHDARRCQVLYWAFMFLIVGLVAALLGFTNIAGGAFAIAKFLAGLFLVLFLIFLVLGLSAAKKIVS